MQIRSIRRFALAAISAGLLTIVAAPRLFAGDPAPVSGDEAAKITRLVEDLGSSDFRIREAATKALIDLGEKARPALETAIKSDSPAVRFRADQILQRLSGPAKEKPLDDGSGVKPDDWLPPSGLPGGPGGLPGGEKEMKEIEEAWRKVIGGQDPAKLREELEKKFKEIEEQMRQALGSANGAFPGLPGVPMLQRARSQSIHLKVDGGDEWAELWEGPRGAKIQFTNKAVPENVTTHSGKSIAQLLEANPKIRDWPGAAELLAKYEETKKAREEEAKAEAQKWKDLHRGAHGGALSSNAISRQVRIEQAGDKTKVTITQAGPDGKPVTKTFEGTDLETMKAENPELQEALGGTTFMFKLGPIVPGGPGSGMGGQGFGPPAGPFGPGAGPKPLREEDDEDGDELPSAAASKATGPFGLALAPVGEVLAAHIGLEAGAGALVLNVRDGSDAAALGLRRFDVITAMNGTPIRELDQVGQVVRNLEKDAPLTIDVIRGAKSQTLKR